MPLLGLFLVLLIAAAGIQAQPKPPATAYVRVSKDGFDPQIVRISKGDRVVWVYDTKPSDVKVIVEHNKRPPAFRSPPLGLGPLGFPAPFPRPGVYHYHNVYDASQTGIVLVDRELDDLDTRGTTGGKGTETSGTNKPTLNQSDRSRGSSQTDNNAVTSQTTPSDTSGVSDGNPIGNVLTSTNTRATSGTSTSHSSSTRTTRSTTSHTTKPKSSSNSHSSSSNTNNNSGNTPETSSNTNPTGPDSNDPPTDPDQNTSITSSTGASDGNDGNDGGDGNGSGGSNNGSNGNQGGTSSSTGADNGNDPTSNAENDNGDTNENSRAVNNPSPNQGANDINSGGSFITMGGKTLTQGQILLIAIVVAVAGLVMLGGAILFFVQKARAPPVESDGLLVGGASNYGT